jgi:hypothetical protein
MPLTNEELQYYLSYPTVAYFGSNDLPPEDPSSYDPYLVSMAQEAAHRGHSDDLRQALDRILADPDFDLTELGSEYYAFSNEQLRDIVRRARQTLWPDAPAAAGQ